MKTKSKAADLLAAAITELLLCGLGLFLLVVTLPACASGEYHWYNWFGLICGLRLATHRSTPKAPKAEEPKQQDEPIES